jgi:putative MFS transporter
MSEQRAVKPPRWMRLAPFLGRPPELTARQWKILGLVAIVSLFEQYDTYLFSLNLKQIQAELGIAESSLGMLGSIVRLGALFALPIALMADRWGRRRILLMTVVVYTLLTGATALAPNAESFVLFQFLSRAFALAETLIAVVVIAEEFAPEHRGWGIGALAAIQACGAGLAAAMFGFVDVIPYGWRSLYLIGLLPLTLIAYWRRTLPETNRFEQVATTLHTTPAFDPIVRLVKEHKRRFWTLSAAVLATGIAVGPATFLAPKFLQDVHGWTPASVALLNLFGGFFAIIGNPVAGRLSDRGGRRPVTSAFAAAFPIVTIAFYSSAGIFSPALWVLLIFTMMGTDVTLSTYGAELFPTSQRSTASGIRSAARDLGVVIGLGLLTVLYGVTGSNWNTVLVLTAIALITPLIVYWTFPETAGRALEDIAPET